MRTPVWIAIVALAAGAGLIVGKSSSSGTHGAATSQFALPLAAAGGPAKIEVDRYAPPAAASTLFVFLQGNDPSEPDEHIAFASEVGATFQRRGIDVAAITFQVSPEAPLRDCAAAVASAIAEVDKGGKYTRVTLAGRGVGAWAAAMLALDRRFFDDAKLDAKKITGVIGMRGTYDLHDAELEGHPDRVSYVQAAPDRKEASPIAFLRPDAPPFLLIEGGNDTAIWPKLDRKFALALEKQGVDVERFIVPFRDQHSLTHWTGANNDLGEVVVNFVNAGLKPLDADSGALELQQRWNAHAPLDVKEFRADASKLHTYPVDAAFKKTTDILFARYPYVLNQLAGKTYEAVDLSTWLASRPEAEVGKGDWLTVSNGRGEQLYYTRAQIEDLKPVIVVGLDDEPNPYKLFGYYRLKHAYSWKKGEEPMPLMIRPLGAFLHFQKPVPEGLGNRTYAQFGLTPQSFKWTATDPLAAVEDLPATIKPTMIGEQGCLKCHAFRGAGAKSHHMASATGETYGAFALGLEEYPPEVLRRFLYEQDDVARGFDVTPLHVQKPVADELYATVSASRK